MKSEVFFTSSVVQQWEVREEEASRNLLGFDPRTSGKVQLCRPACPRQAPATLLPGTAAPAHPSHRRRRVSGIGGGGQWGGAKAVMEVVLSSSVLPTLSHKGNGGGRTEGRRACLDMAVEAVNRGTSPSSSAKSPPWGLASQHQREDKECLCLRL